MWAQKKLIRRKRAKKRYAILLSSNFARKEGDNLDIRCLLEQEIYTDRSGISEFRVVEEGTGKRFTARGILHDRKTGTRLVLNDVSGLDMGGCISYRSVHTVTSTEEEAVAVLCCANGISEKTARLLTEEFGVDVFGYLDRPDFARNLMKLPGIGPSKAGAVIGFLRSQAGSNEEYVWLMGKGFPYLSAMQIIKEHGNGAKAYVLFDPYGPMYKGQACFEVCDAIATENGMDAWAEKRVRAVIRTVLEEDAANGNTRMPMGDFLRRCSKLSVWDGGTAIPDEVLSVMAYSAGLCSCEPDGEEYAALRRLKLAEESILYDLKRLKASRRVAAEPSMEEIRQVGQETGIIYNSEQAKVFGLFRYGGVATLTGYPGTGKTTVINGLIRYYMKVYPDAKVLLCAPTGRAASRAGEVSGKEGLTIHKAMKRTPFDNGARRQEPLEYDFIIVDEMSMCDTELFACFLNSVKSGTTVLLAGDPDQLPSVGPGQVFRDLIGSGVIPVFRLAQLVRQDEASGMAKNAKAALTGDQIREYRDFKISLCGGEESIADRVIREAEVFPSMPLILSPIKKGEGGVHELNRKMQEKFKKTDDPIWINGVRFYAGDPVIMTHNNYKYGYYNGESGTLVRAEDGFLAISLPGRTLALEISDASEMALAYAVTIHRAQGTEADFCITVLPEEACHMASGELLNTAFTRAKKEATVVATGRALERYGEAKSAQRECALPGLLSGMAGQTEGRRKEKNGA